MLPTIFCFALVGLVQSDAKTPNSLDTIQLNQSQMESQIQVDNTRKATKSHLYEQLKDINYLKSIKDELMLEFKITSISIGPVLSKQRLSKEKSPRTPIRKSRLARVQQHYGKNFAKPARKWYSPLTDPLTTME